MIQKFLTSFLLEATEGKVLKVSEVNEGGNLEKVMIYTGYRILSDDFIWEEGGEYTGFRIMSGGFIWEQGGKYTGYRIMSGGYIWREGGDYTGFKINDGGFIWGNSKELPW